MMITIRVLKVQTSQYTQLSDNEANMAKELNNLAGNHDNDANDDDKSANESGGENEEDSSENTPDINEKEVSLSTSVFNIKFSYWLLLLDYCSQHWWWTDFW